MKKALVGVTAATVSWFILVPSVWAQQRDQTQSASPTTTETPITPVGIGLSTSNAAGDPFAGMRFDPISGQPGGSGAFSGAGGFRPSSGALLGGAGRGGLGGGFGAGGGFGQQNQNNARLRAQYRRTLAFVPPPVAASAQMASRVSGDVQRSLLQASGLKVQARMEGSTMILSGTAQSNYQRRLAARMARLKPNVRRVRNELVLVSASPAASQ